MLNLLLRDRERIENPACGVIAYEFAYLIYHPVQSKSCEDASRVVEVRANNNPLLKHRFRWFSLSLYLDNHFCVTFEGPGRSADRFQTCRSSSRHIRFYGERLFGNGLPFAVEWRKILENVLLRARLLPTTRWRWPFSFAISSFLIASRGDTIRKKNLHENTPSPASMPV